MPTAGRFSSGQDTFSKSLFIPGVIYVAVEKPKIEMLVESRHPFAAEAKRRGQTSIEGGLCDFYVPLPGTEE